MCKGSAKRLCKSEVQKEASAAGDGETGGRGGEGGGAEELRLRGGQAQT